MALLILQILRHDRHEAEVSQYQAVKRLNVTVIFSDAYRENFVKAVRLQSALRFSTV